MQARVRHPALLAILPRSSAPQGIELRDPPASPQDRGMTVFLNGEIVPEQQAVVSVFDRGFLYGDGLFEGMRVFAGKPFRWAQHWERLNAGATFLGIKMPFSEADLRLAAEKLIRQNDASQSLLRLTVSRGIGPRGYSPVGAEKPTIVMSLHPMPTLNPSEPVQWGLITSTQRVLANDPISRFKTSNKLVQVLARAEADRRGANEALITNDQGEVSEGTTSNIFWVENGVACTPPLAAGALPGVTRQVVNELCHTLGIEVRETGIIPEALQQAQGVFLSLTSFGIVEVVTIDTHGLSQSSLVPRLREEYWKLVERECGS